MTHSRADSVALGQLHHGVLDNGIRWTCWCHDGDTVISQQVWVAAGSAHESPRERGVAHFVEHLLFRGSQACPDGALDARAEEAGANINAFTWLDYTAYTATFAPEATELLCQLEADRIFHPLLSTEAARQERDIITQERRSEVESSEESLLDEALLARAFGAHPYGAPTLGYHNDIERLSAAGAKRWHARTHVPQQIHVVAAGAVDPAVWVRHLEASFGTATSRKVRRPTLPALVRPAGGTTSTRQAVPLDLLQIALPVGPAASQDRDAALTLCELLAGAASSPLVALLERDAAIAQDLDLDVMETAGATIAILNVTMRPGHTAGEALDHFDRLLKRLRTEGLGDALERTHARWTDDHLSAWQCTESRATQLGECVTLLGNPEHVHQRPFLSRSTSHEALQDLLTRWVQPEERHVVLVEATGSHA